MGIKRIKTQSQRITSSWYLKKKKSKNRCRFWLFQKNLVELSGFTKTWKRGARHVFGWLFYFYNLGSGFQDLYRWDLSFKTSTDKLIELIYIWFEIRPTFTLSWLENNVNLVVFMFMTLAMVYIPTPWKGKDFHPTP